MANPEHLKVLKSGPEAWNKWRQGRGEGRFDLSRADLSMADLSGANLRMADLSGADLRMADLSGADLSRADLSMADLSRADLSGAELSMADLSAANLIAANLSSADFSLADLSRADLSMADLSRADLSAANLRWVDVREADLSEAVVGWTMFADVDLSKCKGLDTIQHAGPSTIGIDTVYASNGQISEIFLRGAGVPDAMITYSDSLVGKPIQFYSCFISYSAHGEDDEFARRLHSDLQSHEVRCWFAPHDLKIGDRTRPTIDEAIRLYDKLLVVLSERSLGSDWVEREVETAFEKERQRKTTVLFPVRLDDVVMTTDQAWAADLRRTRNIGDFRQWKDHDRYKTFFDRLLRDLRASSA